MSRLSWGTVGERVFEAGVDRGVLYLDGKAGVPWNGLISVTESPTGGEVTSFYIDGVKYYNKRNSEEFEATIVAYTYPLEFGQCDGSLEIRNGLFATQQARTPFALAYRSKIGNDVQGAEYAYKIHLIFGATVSPASQEHASINDSMEPFNFSWDISTKAPPLGGYRPTAHFVIDSRNTPHALLLQIEDILYGTSSTVARIPSIPELTYVFEAFNSSLFDAGLPPEISYGLFDAGAPASVNTSTVDGGAP